MTLNDSSPVWIDREVTRTRFSMWRTRSGFHYEDTYPHDGSDVEVGYRLDTVVTGVVFGVYPELGDVSISVGEPPRMRVTCPVEHGAWVRVTA